MTFQKSIRDIDGPCLICRIGLLAHAQNKYLHVAILQFDTHVFIILHVLLAYDNL